MQRKRSPINSGSFSFRNDDWLSRFFTAHYYSFLRFAVKYLHDDRAAEDILQDTIVKLILTGKEFNGENEAKAYIYRVIRNKSLNYLKSEKIKKEKGPVEINRGGEDETFFGYVLEEELFGRLFEEIDKLPEQTRNVIMLALEGKRNQEIADRLDIGIETVKTHKKIGKDLLRKRMGDIMPLFLYLWLSAA